MMTVTKEKPILFSGPMIRSLLRGEKTQTRRIVKPQPEQSETEPRKWYKQTGRGHGTTNVRIRELIECETGEALSREEWFVPVEKWLLGFSRIDIGDVLWVRETFAIETGDSGSPPENPLGPVRWNHHEWEGSTFECPRYRASEPETFLEIGHDEKAGMPKMVWTPSIFMPRWASRITLEVTDVRVERLKDISDDDCWAEGLFRIGDDLQTPQDVLVCDKDHLEPGMAFVVHPKPYWTYAGNPREAFATLWDSINNPRDYCPDDAPHGWHANPYVFAYTFKVLEIKQ